jgi:hypothetical protein
VAFRLPTWIVFGIGPSDGAMTAGRRTHRLVAERFGGQLRIGIGTNTGVVIAGTIGGAGKLDLRRTPTADPAAVGSQLAYSKEEPGECELRLRGGFPQPPNTGSVRCGEARRRRERKGWCGF